MKKIINGKTYNTKTAKRLCDGAANLAFIDPRDLSEYLYRSPKGQFFIAGCGGPMTKYSQLSGKNPSGWGEGLKLVTESEAKSYVENFGTAEEFEAIFTTTEG